MVVLTKRYKKPVKESHEHGFMTHPHPPPEAKFKRFQPAREGPEVTEGSDQRQHLPNAKNSPTISRITRFRLTTSRASRAAIAPFPNRAAHHDARLGVHGEGACGVGRGEIHKGWLEELEGDVRLEEEVEDLSDGGWKRSV